jgi:tight adherence protein C
MLTIASVAVAGAPGHLLPFAAVAVAAAWSAWALLTLVTCRRPERLHPFEQSRREQMRNGSRIYKLAEPLIDDLGSRLRQSFPKLCAQLDLDLPLSGRTSHLRAEDFLATRAVLGALSGLTILLLLGPFQFGWSLALAPTVCCVSIWLECRSVHDRAEARRKAVRLRLPFAVDLIALMMEAGGGFQECLQTVVDEHEGHPLGEEFHRALLQIRLGRPRDEALRAFQERINDPDVDELVFAINKGEELGTPLSRILRDQAAQMQIKRAQWGEMAAADAEVKIIFPGILTMVACLLVIVATFVLPALTAM